MRIIKFRSWDKQFRRMKVTGMGINYGILDGEGVEIMQYTGLKDKNGVEIYECDIVKSCNGNMSGVYWEKNTTGFVLIPNNTILRNEVHLGLMHTRLEVIGNFYENPELLEE